MSLVPTPPFIPARWHGGSQVPHAVVIHGTVSPCAHGEARDTAHFFATENNKTSAHYIVDPGEVIQAVGDHTVAFHCGYNSGSISVELCDPQAGSGKRWQDSAHQAMLRRAADLVGDLCLAYGISVEHTSVGSLKARGPHGIYGHNDSRLAFGHTTHSDPGPDFPWAQFLGLVEARIKTRTAKPAPAPHYSPSVLLHRAISGALNKYAPLITKHKDYVAALREVQSNEGKGL